MAGSSTQQISGDEAQIYDRQIRLWGLEAQNRLRNSSVLLVGMSGLGAEVAKNLMLSGIKALTLIDDEQVSAADKYSQFFIPPDATGTRAQASLDRLKVLNPMVDVAVDTGSVEDKPEEFLRRFDLVILIDQSHAAMNGVNKTCRKLKVRFQAGAVFGWIGFAFFDFNNHTFLVPKPKSFVDYLIGDDEDDEADKKAGSSSSAAKKAKPAVDGVPTITLEGGEEDAKIKKNIQFPSFEQTFNTQLGTKKLLRRRFSLPAAYYVIRAFLRLMKEKGRGNKFSQEEAVEQWKKELELACVDPARQKIRAEDFALFAKPALNPVCAIVGSLLGQEAIKALSQNDVPLKSVFLYSAVDSVGAVCEISN